MPRYFRGLAKTGFVGSALLGLVSSGCGGAAPTIRQQVPTDEHPGIPVGTVGQLQECVKEYGHQLDGGSWAFSPKIQVDQEGYVVDVNAGDMPRSASDLAACTRIALGAMEIPSEIFTMRPKDQNTAAIEPTREQRSSLSSPAVAVIVVIGLSELVLDAGAYTILFAISVELVHEAAKRRRNPKNECAERFAECIMNPLGWGRGNNWNESRCGTCLHTCTNNNRWPSHIDMFGEGLVPCN